ncbi:MAG: hypothetical protein GF353_21245 [Candidatus Lokiarchaeota archaeon]|nr:hypothetical protein [Candidatus Lokiarchaeota archaeon]
MKILVDTSYFLPFIKIKIEKFPQDTLINLLYESSNKFFYSELSIFELTAKGMKISSQKGKITPQDIRIGIDALTNDTRLTKLSFIDNPLIIVLANHLRTFHKDTIDCLIFATAICMCDCIVTMDVVLYELIRNNPPLVNHIQEVNEGFKFWFDDLSSDYKEITSNYK